MQRGSDVTAFIISMMVNLECHLDWIYDHLEDTPLGMPMKAFPERLNSGGKTSLAHE